MQPEVMEALQLLLGGEVRWEGDVVLENGEDWDNPRPWNSFFMSMFANRFDKGAVGVVGDDMDNKMIHSDIKVGAEADKEDMGSLALSIEPKATAKLLWLCWEH